MPLTVVLGAGVTGLTAAWALSKVHLGRVVLLEKEPGGGGLAATFTKDNLAFDFGSHRLHEGYDPEVGALIRDLCGGDLLRRPRRGLIYLRGRALNYPPSPFDILFAFGPGDALRFVRDFLLARLCRAGGPPESNSFEGFTVGKVGRSLYERFYKPYALKLYGMSPRKIAKDPAVSRVRKFSLASFGQDLKRKLLRQKPEYLYPAQGIGQLARVLQQRFLDNGGRLVPLSRVDKIRIRDDRLVDAVEFTTEAGRTEVVRTGHVVSTIPLDALHHLVALDADRYGRPAFDLQWRGLRLLYLVTRDKVPSEHETFYFPEPDILFGRVSELHRYSPALNPDPGRAVLAIEVPCSCDDDVWNLPDDRLADLCVRDLQRLGILRSPSSGGDEFFSKRVRNVYPVYDLGWRERFNKIYQRLDGLENLYLIGRTALFLHCNIDHCMAMALRLAKHLAGGPGDKRQWESIRQEFFDYRVRE
jgi:protoporphyrinogen oxidase